MTPLLLLCSYSLGAPEFAWIDRHGGWLLVATSTTNPPDAKEIRTVWYATVPYPPALQRNYYTRSKEIYVADVPG